MWFISSYSEMVHVVLGLLGLALIASLARLWKATSRPKGFPPGPGTLPFIGNLHQVPPRRSFLQYHEWQKTHGSILGLKFGTMNVVILSNWRHVKELLEKRGSSYASRPPHYIGDNLLYPGQLNLLFTPYGQTHRAFRRAFNTFLNPTALASFLPIQEAQALVTLQGLIKTPANYREHINGYTAALILASIFGQRTSSDKLVDPRIALLYESTKRLTRLVEPATAPPVDLIPLLKYLPEKVCWWKKEARWLRTTQSKLYGGLLKDTKARIKEGRANGCFMEKMLADQEKYGLNDEQMVYLGGMTLEAGLDTTASVLMTFLLAMVKYPQVLKKAQEEVDALCGTDRIPTYQDGEKLPYINAVITEVQRWRPIVPTGLPHMSTQDDVYDGYFIPAGTTVFCNAYSIQHDEREYDSPAEFRPERWLDNKFGTIYDSDDRGNSQRRVLYGFGAGRRVCPGQHLAEQSLIINVAKLIWCLDITVPENTVVDDSYETAFAPEFLTAPEKFPCIIKPRSLDRVKVLEKALEQAKDVFAKYDVR